MDRLWINYRRGGRAAEPAQRIHRRLVRRFGADRVTECPDLASDPERDLTDLAAMLVVIEPGWLEAIRRTGRDAEDDAHCRWIVSALRRQIGVVPILLDGAQLPSAGTLPAGLDPLGERHALRIGADDLERDLENLERFLEHYLPAGFVALAGESRTPETSSTGSLGGSSGGSSGETPWRLLAVEEWFARARQAGLDTIEERRLARVAARKPRGEEDG